MINQVTLVGRLTADPELRYTPSGIPFAFFTLAIRRDFRNQQGEVESDFVRVRVWRKQAENLANFCQKGDIIGMEGKIQTGSYDGQDGKKVYTTDVVADKISFIQLKGRNNQGGGQQNYGNQQGGNQQGGGYGNQQGGNQQGGGYGNQQGGNQQGGGYGNQQGGNQQGGGYGNQQGGQGGGYNQGGGNSYPPQQQPPQQQQPTNYTRVDEDPFANSKGPIEVSEDDLPF